MAVVLGNSVVSVARSFCRHRGYLSWSRRTRKRIMSASVVPFRGMRVRTVATTFRMAVGGASIAVGRIWERFSVDAEIPVLTDFFAFSS